MSCPICYENLSKDTITIEGCNHTFHSKCIYKWINNNESPSCPLCRCQIVPRSMRSKKNIINNIISKELKDIYNILHTNVIVDVTKNNEDIETEINNQEKIIFEKLTKCLIKFPYILVNNKYLKNIICEQSKMYNNENMIKICENL